MHYETARWVNHSFLFTLPSLLLFSFHSDTHSLGSWFESNLRDRCSISSWCTTKQQGESITLSSSLYLHYHYSHFIQTLTQLDLNRNQISETGAQYLADALRNSKVSQSLFPLHFTFILVILITFRHSFNWILVGMESQRLVSVIYWTV
jgi:hypothetical protein